MLLVAHRDGLGAQRVVRRDSNSLERRRVVVQFLAAEGEVLLLGLDDLRVGPVWKSRSELHIAWTFVNLTGLSEIGSDTEARMACSILDLSWRTCGGRA